MLAKPRLRAFVVVWSHDKQRVGSRKLRIVRQRRSSFGVIAAAASDERDLSLAAVDPCARKAPYLLFFVCRKHRRFARCARHHERVRSAVDLAVDKRAERVEINVPGVVKWGHERGADPGKYRVSAHLSAVSLLACLKRLQKNTFCYIIYAHGALRDKGAASREYF